MKHLRPFLLAVVLGSIVLGQLFRFQVFSGSAGGLLVSDVIVLLLAAVFWTAVLLRRVTVPGGWVTRIFFAWVIAVALSFLLAAHHYTHGQLAVGLAYLVRLFGYASLLFWGWTYLARSEFLVVRYFAYVCLALLILGAVVLRVEPNFIELVPLGWDPHVGRLTSTWLDPNYFGSFLAIAFAFLLPYAERAERSTRRFLPVAYYLLMLMIWGGIYLTYSRSALATLVVGGVAAGLLTRWKNLAFAILLIVVMVAMPSRLQSRFASSVSYTVSSVSSGASSNSATAAAVDPTANARVQSWKRAIAVFKDAPVFGVGYNLYQYHRLNTGTASAREVADNHSASGSDSSLLTLLATTGAVGLALFLAWLGAIWLRLWRVRRLPVAAGALALLLAWLASSFFNNTMLFAHIMLPCFLLVGVALAQTVGDDAKRAR